MNICLTRYQAYDQTQPQQHAQHPTHIYRKLTRNLPETCLKPPQNITKSLPKPKNATTSPKRSYHPKILVNILDNLTYDTY